MSADAYIWYDDDGNWHAWTDGCSRKAHEGHWEIELGAVLLDATDCYGRPLFWTPGDGGRIDGWGYYRKEPNLS